MPPIEDLAKLYSSLRDEELRLLAIQPDTLTSEARAALFAELRKRKAARPEVSTAESHIRAEWYEVRVPRQGIAFPEICPKCLVRGALCGVNFTSNCRLEGALIPHTKKWLETSIPHCPTCESHLMRQRRMANAYMICVIVVVFVISIVQHWTMFETVASIALLCAPATFWYRRPASVRVLGYDGHTVTFAFRSDVYADEFERLNSPSQCC
jgi:hypothetical protein